MLVAVSLCKVKLEGNHLQIRNDSSPVPTQGKPSKSLGEIAKTHIRYLKSQSVAGLLEFEEYYLQFQVVGA
jgi:hypothetical protein